MCWWDVKPYSIKPEKELADGTFKSQSKSQVHWSLETKLASRPSPNSSATWLHWVTYTGNRNMGHMIPAYSPPVYCTKAVLVVVDVVLP